jgi:hypothetical protein
LSIVATLLQAHISAARTLKGGIEMDKIFTLLRNFFAGLLDEACPADPVSRMTPRELADLPVHHPRC